MTTYENCNNVPKAGSVRIAFFPEFDHYSDWYDSLTDLKAEALDWWHEHYNEAQEDNPTTQERPTTIYGYLDYFGYTLDFYDTKKY